jgi:hypothetical protein
MYQPNDQLFIKCKQREIINPDTHRNCKKTVNLSTHSQTNKNIPKKNTHDQIEFLKVINRSSKCLSASMHIIYQPFHKFTNKNVLAIKM